MNTEEIENYKVLLKYLMEMRSNKQSRKIKKEHHIDANVNNFRDKETNEPIIATITNEGIIGIYTGQFNDEKSKTR